MVLRRLGLRALGSGLLLAATSCAVEDADDAATSTHELTSTPPCPVVAAPTTVIMPQVDDQIWVPQDYVVNPAQGAFHGVGLGLGYELHASSIRPPAGPWEDTSCWLYLDPSETRLEAGYHRIRAVTSTSRSTAEAGGVLRLWLTLDTPKQTIIGCTHGAQQTYSTHNYGPFTWRDTDDVRTYRRELFREKVGALADVLAQSPMAATVRYCESGVATRLPALPGAVWSDKPFSLYWEWKRSFSADAPPPAIPGNPFVAFQAAQGPNAHLAPFGSFVGTDCRNGIQYCNRYKTGLFLSIKSSGNIHRVGDFDRFGETPSQYVVELNRSRSAQLKTQLDDFFTFTGQKSFTFGGAGHTFDCTTDHCRFVLEKSDSALELTEATEHQFE